MEEDLSFYQKVTREATKGIKIFANATYKLTETIDQKLAEVIDNRELRHKISHNAAERILADLCWYRDHPSEVLR